MIVHKPIHIQKAQDEYFDKLKEYERDLDDPNLSARTISMMLEDLKCFWLKRLEIVGYELDELANSYTGFLLSGAVYLNVSGNEHYYFKSLGDFHLLSDPFLKMEPFFRLPEEDINPEEQIDYFKRVYADTTEILAKYRNWFYILPINELSGKHAPDRLELLEIFFLRFISSFFEGDFDSKEAFCETHKTYEEIESSLGDTKLKFVVFNDRDDLELSLRERVERYYKDHMSFSYIVQNKTEAQIFLLVLYCHISQAADALLTCTSLMVNPFIRYDITFNYFALIMQTFTKDTNLRSMIEKTLVFYVLYRSIDEEQFKALDFIEYCKRLENKSLIEAIIGNLHSSGIDITKGGFEQVSSIILEEFKSIL